jgi:ribonuclease Z
LLNVNERFFLIDCGEGTQIQLRRHRIGFGKINHIFISHNHGDHIFGLYGLLSSFQLLGRKAELKIYGPENLRAFLNFYFNNYMTEDDYRITFIPVGHRGTQRIYEDRQLEVLSIPLKHRTPTTGFLVKEKTPELNIRKEAVEKYRPGIEDIVKVKKGEDLILEDGSLIPNKELTLPPWKPRSYAYISDTAYHPKIVQDIRNVDILYHEATFAEADAAIAKDTFHSTATDAAKIAKAAGVNKLLIGHFSTRYKIIDKLLEEARSSFDESYAVEDGDVYSVERRREKI